MKLSMLLLEAAFFSAILAVSAQAPVLPSAPWLVLMAMATLRLARTLSFNEIGEPLRYHFCEVQPDSCKAGSNVHPKEGSKGLVYAIGSLLSCPICTGTWSALFLYSAWLLFPSVGSVLVIVLGLAGASEMLHWSADLIEWTGRSARVVSGLLSPDKPKDEEVVCPKSS